MPARSRKTGDEPDPAAAAEPDPAGEPEPEPLTAEEQAAIRDRLRRKYH